MGRSPAVKKKGTKMKKFLLITAILLFAGGVAFAAVGYKNAQTPIGTATDINCNTGTRCTFDGSTLTVDAINWTDTVK